MDKKGSLKTGRVTALVCLALLVTAAVSFEIVEPVVEQVVLVKQLFKPEEVIKTKTEPVEVKSSAELKKVKNKVAPANPAKKEVKKVETKRIEQTTKVTHPAKNQIMQDFVELAEKPVTVKSKPLKFADIDRLHKVISTGLAVGQQQVALPKEGANTSDKLNSTEFLSLMQSWRLAGSANDGVKKMSLEIQGLREMYSFLQMKPVAVSGTRFFDLATGDQISEVSLADYSSTVFAVTNASQKFGEELGKLGLLDKQGVEVRYYMYDFIRNSIFARANTAYKWCLNQGLISKDTVIADVEVTGGAFMIAQQGGGQFAVFVPQQIRTAKGEVATVSPDCFAGQTDVNFLKQKGVL